MNACQELLRKIDHNVMYGSAGCEKVLELSRGRVLHVKVHYNTQCSSLGSLVFACLGDIRETDMHLNMYITL